MLCSSWLFHAIYHILLIHSAYPGVLLKHFAVSQASGSPVRKGGSQTGPSNTAGVATHRASVLPKLPPDSSLIVDLCNSPLPKRKLATSPVPNSKACGSMRTAADAAAADDIDQADMMDISQSPNMHTDGSSESKAAAATQSQAQGSTAPLLGLAMGDPMSGSADPYWQRLSDLIVQGGIAAVHADELRRVFAVEQQDRWRGHVPAYLLSGGLFLYCICVTLVARISMQPPEDDVCNNA